ncbi:MAG: hypothetical protein IPP29_15245 [Bacteroidetes bacterium]|nr:hypothetical protein [Bacteroidota bacterium]
MMRKIILFELNEVPWRVVKYYCDKNPDSTFAKILPQCFKYETVTPDQGHLSPWITWPTLHRGVDNTKHGIGDLNQDLEQVNKDYPPIWQILQKNGIKTGVFGSMHSSPVPSDFRKYVFYVPDAFAVDKTAHPEYIEPFQDFNLSMSRESARNVSGGINMKTGSQMLMKVPQLGFKMNTFFDLGKQLLDERKRPWVRTRRRTYQVVLAFDVFMKQMRKSKPQFVTFFSNHVASSMHRYWAATFPGDYKQFDIGKDWVDTYKNEIDFTMNKFDKFFNEMVAFANENPDYKIVVASSMGQASTVAELLDSQLLMGNEAKFFEFLKMDASQWKHVPSMFPQYNVTIIPEKVEYFANQLKRISIAGRPLEFRQMENGFFAVDLGQKNLKEKVIQFDGKDYSFEETGFENMEIDDHSGSTAYHIPEGTLVIYDPQDKSIKKEITQIPSTALVPSIVKNFDIPMPAYLKYQPIAGIN